MRIRELLPTRVFHTETQLCFTSSAPHDAARTAGDAIRDAARTYLKTSDYVKVTWMPVEK